MNLKERKAKSMDISALKLNDKNPRYIRDEKFEKLIKSLTDFPKMLEYRPILVNKDLVVLGGNMRLRAAKEIGLTKIPVVVCDELTEEEQRELIIKDNVGYGEWDWEMLANDWNKEELEDWGLDVRIDTFEGEEVDQEVKPSASDDNYSVYELIMLHENKLLLLETLNKVKDNYMFEKQEEALMEILRKYNSL
jgi:hypothetical protein